MFVLTTDRVITTHPYTDGTVLKFRRFEGTERDEFDKQRSKLAGRKNFWPKYVKLIQQVAARLCVEWEGIVDANKKPLECNDTNKAAFFAHPETEKYWWAPIYGYLNPQKVSDDATPQELGEAEDPDFFASK